MHTAPLGTSWFFYTYSKEVSYSLFLYFWFAKRIPYPLKDWRLEMPFSYKDYREGSLVWSLKTTDSAFHGSDPT